MFKVGAEAGEEECLIWALAWDRQERLAQVPWRFLPACIDRPMACFFLSSWFPSTLQLCLEPARHPQQNSLRSSYSVSDRHRIFVRCDFALRASCSHPPPTEPLRVPTPSSIHPSAYPSPRSWSWSWLVCWVHRLPLLFRRSGRQGQVPYRGHLLADGDGRARHASPGQRHADQAGLLLLPLLRNRGDMVQASFDLA